MASVYCHGDGPEDYAEESLPSEDVCRVLVVESHDLRDKAEDAFQRVQVEDLLTLLIEQGVGEAVGYITVCILANERPVHVTPPAVHVDVLEVDVPAWVRGVAADDAWREETTLGGDVPECDVPHVDQWLGLAALKWVGHATCSATIWLLLLLWPDVDTEPDRVVDLYVLVEDVSDLSGAVDSWISLDINCLHGIFKVDILESHASDASMGVLWRHRANGGSYAEHDRHVLNVNVLGAAVSGDDAAILVRGLDRDRIVPVGDLYVFDGHVGALRVDSVRVERHRWPGCPVSLAREEEVDD